MSERPAGGEKDKAISGLCFKNKNIELKMDEKTDILSKVNRNDGMTVPEGFFEAFAERMAAELPDRPEAERPQIVVPQRTLWGRIRPYVYMAAMFAGIWCMLKMFTMMTGSSVDFSVDQNHILTDALSDENFVFDYIIDDVNSREVFDDMYGDSIDVEDLTPVDSLLDEPAAE